jgi:hypothetical protein
MSGSQTTPYQARNEYQQGQDHPKGRRLLESKQGTVILVSYPEVLLRNKSLYANVVNTSSSAVPYGQETTNEMSNDDCNYCIVPHETACNHGRANTPCRSTYTRSIRAVFSGRSGVLTPTFTDPVREEIPCPSTMLKLGNSMR